MGDDHEEEIDEEVNRYSITLSELDLDDADGLVDFYDENGGPNVIVMSDAAKPIYCRWGDEEELGTLCSLIQAIRGSICDQGKGDLQFLEVSGNMRVAFLSVGALTLVAISNSPMETEAYLRLQLEYVYGQIIFTLTDHVQKVLQKNPNMDIRNMLGSTHHIMDGILDAAGPLGQAGPFLVAGVEMVCPISPQIREHVSKRLRQVCCEQKEAAPLFAFLFLQRKLLTVIQPSHLQLHTADIHLLINYVHCHSPTMTTNELWFPICLPTLNSSGFVHAYATSLDPTTKLSIVLISPDKSPEQFSAFRTVARHFRQQVNLPDTADTQILRISATPHRNLLNNHHNLPPPHTDDDIQHVDKEFFQSKTNHPDSMIHTTTEYDHPDQDNHNHTEQPSHSQEEQTQLPFSEPSTDSHLSPHTHTHTTSSIKHTAKSNKDTKNKTKHEVPDLRAALAHTLKAEVQEQMFQEYCSIATAMHFVFRCDVFIRAETGRLSQCFASPFTFPFLDAVSKRQIWSIYQRLSLRLRLGSSTLESTMDALDYHSMTDTSNTNVQKDCPTQTLLETPPLVHGVSYIVDGNELFIALNGKDFELYATLPATVPPKTGTMLCARLVRRIWADEAKLFLARPLTWPIK